MPALVIPNALLVACSGSYLGQPWTNVYGLSFASTAPLSQGEVDTIGGPFVTLYQSLAAMLHGSWTLSEIVIQDVRSATAPAWDVAFIPTINGTSSGDPLPPQMAAVASHRTAFRGQSYRGRTYLCGFTEPNNNNAGSIENGAIANIEAAFEELRDDLSVINSGAVEFSVLSRKLLVATPIVSTTCDPEWDRQNRRKRVS